MSNYNYIHDVLDKGIAEAYSRIKGRTPIDDEVMIICDDPYTHKDLTEGDVGKVMEWWGSSRNNVKNVKPDHVVDETEDLHYDSRGID